MSLHALPCPRENITHKFVAHCKALTHAGHRWSKLFQVDPRPLRLGLAFNGSNYISNDLKSTLFNLSPAKQWTL